ncbi:cell wall protein DAN4-like [Cottoperca gobio]|uniref:Cell wall protein DAN4-like n=1 Tax=Cottoperca gobio TaxID=56716 RepID=A0A6J2RKY6_COTGO|nr:cell wall protein DAN4-like [Cottoperca gobio]
MTSKFSTTNNVSPTMTTTRQTMPSIATLSTTQTVSPTTQTQSVPATIGLATTSTQSTSADASPTVTTKQETTSSIATLSTIQTLSPTTQTQSVQPTIGSTMTSTQSTSADTSPTVTTKQETTPSIATLSTTQTVSPITQTQPVIPTIGSATTQSSSSYILPKVNTTRQSTPSITALSATQTMSPTTQTQSVQHTIGSAMTSTQSTSADTSPTVTTTRQTTTSITALSTTLTDTSTLQITHPTGNPYASQPQTFVPSKAPYSTASLNPTPLLSYSTAESVHSPQTNNTTYVVTTLTTTFTSVSTNETPPQSPGINIVNKTVSSSMLTNTSTAPPATVPFSFMPSPGLVSQTSDSQKPVTTVTNDATDSISLQPSSFSLDASTLNPADDNTTQQQVDHNSVSLSRGNAMFFKYSPNIAAVRPLVFDHLTVIWTTFPVSEAFNADSEEQHEPDQNNTSEIPTLPPEV